MAVTTHTSLPSCIQAGDTLLITATLAEYSAASWTLRYVLSGEGNVYRLDSTASGTSHAFTISAAITGSWQAGEYVAHEYVDNTSGQRVTLGRHSIRIEPNIAVADPDEEHARKVLKSLQAQIEGRAVDGVENYSLGGTSISKMSSFELLRWRNVYRKEVRALEREAKQAAGVGSSRRIVARM